MGLYLIDGNYYFNILKSMAILKLIMLENITINLLIAVLKMRMNRISKNGAAGVG